MNSYKEELLTIVTGLLMITSAAVFSNGHEREISFPSPRGDGKDISMAKNIKDRTAQPGKYLSTWFTDNSQPDETLIVLDIDDTTITSPTGQWLGRSVMFSGLMEDVLEKHPEWSKSQAADYLDPLLVLLYRRVPVSLVDSGLPKVINDLMSRGARVIGMTSRGLATREITLWQLEQCGLTFSDTGPQRSIQLTGGRQSLIDHGVVFVSHGNRKGEVLDALFREGNAFFESIHHVIMVDDQKQHLTDMGNTLTGKKYSPVLCTYPETQPKYNHDEAIQQLRLFLRQQEDKDPVIKNMTTSDPFTSFLMSSR